MGRQESFWGASKVLFLDVCGVYMGIPILDNSSGCTFMNYTFCMYLNFF